MKNSLNSSRDQGAYYRILKKVLIIVGPAVFIFWIVAYARLSLYFKSIVSIIPVIIAIYTLHHEAEKERKRSVKEKLEKFYSPYYHNMGIIYRAPRWRLGMKEREADLAIVNEISNSTYLILSPETRRVVEEYLQTVKRIDSSGINEEFKELAKQANELVEREYKLLLKELNKLEKK